MLEGDGLPNKPVTKSNLTNVLGQDARSQVPGRRTLVADSDGSRFDYAGTRADIQTQKAMAFAAHLQQSQTRRSVLLK